ncbi:hypothetical protein CC78DRAFT_570810 [Lojkania enalia]|uniref:SAC3/GANP/THP3 conserved domain-containing protein n=1 Tax=Lojkania enalia TaxID=147567 RepID=A0A9P4K412_9PLEO|nr:hypothetical protein CC78DRAFT_570810 [Didymosphaeria enalia]
MTGRSQREGGRGGPKPRGVYAPPRGQQSGRSISDDDRPKPFSRRTQRGGSDFSVRGASPSPGSRNDTRTSSARQSHRGPNGKVPAQDDYQARLDMLNKDRPRLKQQFIAQRMMNPDGQMRIEDSVRLQAICTDMCPEHERVRRIVQNDVKLPEYTAETAHGPRYLRVPDESRMVKAHQRSSAGRDVELPSDLRTPPTCQKTLHYMFSRLDNEPMGFLYGWLWDRTRAVRKDLTTQFVGTPENVGIRLNCFEQCARFHLITLHHMSNTTADDYNRQQDVEQFSHTLISLRQEYDDNKRNRKIFSPNEPEFWAYMIINSILADGSHIENKIRGLADNVQRNPRVQTAVQIFRAGIAIMNRPRSFLVAHQNWAEFWKLVASPAVSYLMACAAEMSFNDIRHVIMDTIYRAYRQKSQGRSITIQDWTMSDLVSTLGFDSANQVRTFCHQYGFSFGVTAEGLEFLDLTSAPTHGKGLRKPADAPEQTFSWTIVEAKRFDRSFSAVIRGMSVKEARIKGMVVERGLNTKVEPEPEDETLFVPEVLTSQSPDTGLNPFAEPFNPAAPTPGQPNRISAPNGYVNPFTSAEATPNGFTNPFKQVESVSATPNGLTPGSGLNNPLLAQPNSFASASSAKTPSIFKFSSSQSPFNNNVNGLATPNSKFDLSSTMSNDTSSAQSPAGQGIFTTTSPATGQTVQPGLFDATKKAVRFAPLPDANGVSSSSSGGSIFTPTPIALVSSSPTQPVFPASKPVSTFQQVAVTSPFLTLPGQPTFLSRQPFPSLSVSTSQPFQSSQEEKERKLYEEQQRRVQEENQRYEEQQRAQEEKKRHEEEQRRAQEEERRRRGEEQRRAQEAERHRKKEEQRLAAEAQRQAEEAKQARLQQQAEEEKRRAQETQRRQQERDSAYDHLATDLFLNSEQALLKQLLEHVCGNLILEVREDLKHEKAEEDAERFRQWRAHKLAYKALFRWRKKCYDKRLTTHARNRRRWLKEHAAELAALDAQQDADIMVQASSSKKDAELNGVIKAKPFHASGTFKKPSTPASAHSVLKSTKASRITKSSAPRAPGAKSNTKSNAESNTSSLNSPKPTPFEEKMAKSTPYKNPNPPIDRTMTDWFKLRAMGIDPAKHRKRSLDSISDDEDEVDRASESKRRRKSSTPSSRVSLPVTLPQITTGSDPVARVEAVKQSILNRVSRSSGRESRNKRPSPSSSFGSISSPASNAGSTTTSTAALIERARALLAKPTVKSSIVEAHHDFSRSVPDLLFGRSSTGASSFRKSTEQQRPAYWSRNSRFIPRHLYGQGGEIAAAYARDHPHFPNALARPYASTLPSVEPLELSSPTPMQQSYVPESNCSAEEVQYQGSEESSEDEELEDYEEGDDIRDQDYQDDENLEDYDEDEMEFEQYAQKPGGTQDDAIELSD